MLLHFWRSCAVGSELVVLSEEPSGGMALLQIRDLTIRYAQSFGHSSSGDAAVSGVSFDVRTGEIVGVMGQSGCGKTSLALAILGLLDRRTAEVRGSIEFESNNLLCLTEKELQKIRGKRISVVFQEPGISLCPVMRVGNQIAEVIRAHRDWNWKHCCTEAETMLGRVGFAQTARIFAAYPHELSGGQQQRVALAQALACDPELLIADEPTASLDARSQRGFIELLREWKTQRHTSILLISHTPQIQASLADRLLIMKSGEIVQTGSFRGIWEQPNDLYIRLLLGLKSRTCAPNPQAQAQTQPAHEGQVFR